MRMLRSFFLSLRSLLSSWLNFLTTYARHCLRSGMRDDAGDKKESRLIRCDKNDNNIPDAPRFRYSLLPSRSRAYVARNATLFIRDYTE